MEGTINISRKSIVIIILILLAGLIAGVYLVQKTQIFKPKASIETVDLSLQPGQITANPNQETTISVFANAQSLSLTAVELHISYDPSLLTVEIASRSAIPVVLDQPHINNIEDKQEVSMTVGVNPENVFRGSGAIATLKVTPTANFNSAASIQLTDQTKVTILERDSYADRSLNSVTILPPSVSPSPTSTASTAPTSTPSASPAAQTSTVSGKIVGINGVGIADVELGTCNSGINPRSDASGNFSFQIDKYLGFCVRVNGQNYSAVRAINDRGEGSSYEDQIAGRGPVSTDNSGQQAHDRDTDSNYNFILYPIAIAGQIKSSTGGSTVISGVTVKVVKFDGTLQEVTTGTDGKFSISNFLQRGEIYAVRLPGNLSSPQTAPSGYRAPGKTVGGAFTYNESSGADTPAGQESYENQKAGTHHDCAGPINSGSGSMIEKAIAMGSTLGRCNFVYDPI